jgi:hypothetical protein
MSTESSPESTSDVSWPWPESMDALKAAADQHHLLFENDRVRVLQTSIPAGGRVAVHTHQWPSVLYVQSWSHFVRRDHEGTILLDTRTSDAFQNPVEVFWAETLPPHTLENVGEADLTVLAVEVKYPVV